MLSPVIWQANHSPTEGKGWSAACHGFKMLVFGHIVANSKRFCLNQSTGPFCRLLCWKWRQMNTPGYSCPVQSLEREPFQRYKHQSRILMVKPCHKQNAAGLLLKGRSSTLPEPCILCPVSTEAHKHVLTAGSKYCQHSARDPTAAAYKGHWQTCQMNR